METLIYTANFLYILSYLVRDILHLRMLTVVAAGCLAYYFYSLPEPLMTVVYWNVFFIGLNSVQLIKLTHERMGHRGDQQIEPSKMEGSELKNPEAPQATWG